MALEFILRGIKKTVRSKGTWARGRGWMEEENEGEKKQCDLRLSKQETSWVARK